MILRKLRQLFKRKPKEARKEPRWPPKRWWQLSQHALMSDRELDKKIRKMRQREKNKQ